MRVTDIDFRGPFLGFAVNVTRHVPTDTNFTVVPTALQYFFEAVAMVTEIWAPAGTTKLLYFAITRAARAFFDVMLGATTGATVEVVDVIVVVAVPVELVEPPK